MKLSGSKESVFHLFLSQWGQVVSPLPFSAHIYSFFLSHVAGTLMHMFPKRQTASTSICDLSGWPPSGFSACLKSTAGGGRGGEQNAISYGKAKGQTSFTSGVCLWSGEPQWQFSQTLKINLVYHQKENEKQNKTKKMEYKKQNKQENQWLFKIVTVTTF